MQKILITGGSGLVGTKLTSMLMAKGYRVVHLGRSHRNSEVPVFVWDINSRMIEKGALDGVDVIVHLAGANVGERPWTKRRKKEILESRTHSSRLLFEYLQKEKHQVKHFISASAIGYYGFENGERVFREHDSPGNDFLADVVRRWESEVDQIATLGIRVVKVRVGIVLSQKEGALAELAKPIRFMVGAPLGSGNQKLSWIHLDDLCRVFIKAIENASIEGPLNAVGPAPVTNRQLTKAVADVLGKPLWMPAVPAFALRLLLGEMADLALRGNSVSNEKLLSYGFRYNFPDLEGALKNLLSEP